MIAADLCGTPTDLDVPRETFERLATYVALLTEWQERLNLVAPSTIPQIWTRHIADSAQLLTLAPSGARWIDMGAGAGFPGLVVAIIDGEARLTLVEATAKKCRFLEAVVAELGLEARVTVANCRIEAMPPRVFDVVTARALAPLTRLFDLGLGFAGPATRWLLPKGARFEEELDDARRRFRFDHHLVPSRTNADARIIVASTVARR